MPKMPITEETHVKYTQIDQTSRTRALDLANEAQNGDYVEEEVRLRYATAAVALGQIYIGDALAAMLRKLDELDT
jgi:hypothetical protein